MSRAITIALAAILALCAGCGSRPKIKRLSAGSVIVAFGDSLTFGTGASDDESYPFVLAEMMGCRVVSEGVPGENTSAGLMRLPSVLTKDQPDLIIICHGGNDMLHGQDPSITTANLNAMVSMAKGAGADVILIAVPRPALFLKPSPIYQEVAAKHGIPCNEEDLSKIISSPALMSDPIHPNASGYRQLAKSIRALITKSQSD
jgi:lysophospholipase L1-like esterase